MHGAVSPEGEIPLAVTVSGKAGPDLLARARERASAWGLPYLERGRKQPLAPLLERVGALLVFEAEGLVLTDGQGALRSHEGMAHLRVHRFEAGLLDDMLLKISGLKTGESVLDCTLGLAADARVAARAVGFSGRVVGLEASLPLFALSSEGLASEHRPRSASIEVHLARAGAFLARQPDGAFDCVLLDPMFGRPKKASAAFEMLRRFADASPLSPELIAEARRVARRVVVVKAARYSTDLKKLGLKPEPATRTATVLWARVDGSASAGARDCP